MSFWVMLRPAFQHESSSASSLQLRRSNLPRCVHSTARFAKDSGSKPSSKSGDAEPSFKSSVAEPYSALVASSSSSLPTTAPRTYLPSPALPKSTKSLNRLLGSSPAKLRRSPPLLDKDIKETFIRGSGPGGQAINKLNTNVSLVHLPTGIRVTYQEMRTLEENRRGARKLLGEKLAALNPDASPLPSRGDVLAAKAKLKKDRAKKRSRKKYGNGEGGPEEKIKAIGPGI